MTSGRCLLYLLAVLGSLLSGRYFSAGVLQWRPATGNNFLGLNRAEVAEVQILPAGRE